MSALRIPPALKRTAIATRGILICAVDCYHGGEAEYFVGAVRYIEQIAVAPCEPLPADCHDDAAVRYVAQAVIMAGKFPVDAPR